MKGPDVKQFRCTHPGCEKVFNRKDYLERHAANHLFVKPFVCKLCNRQFSRRDLYDNHLMTKRHARAVLEAENNVDSDGRLPTNRRSPIDGTNGSQFDKKIVGDIEATYDAKQRAANAQKPELYFQDANFRYYAEPLHPNLRYGMNSNQAYLGGPGSSSPIDRIGRGRLSFDSSRGTESILSSSISSDRSQRFMGNGIGFNTTLNLTDHIGSGSYSFDTASQASQPISFTSSVSSYAWSDYRYSANSPSAPPFPRSLKYSPSEFSSDLSIASSSGLQSLPSTTHSAKYEFHKQPENFNPIKLIEDWLKRDIDMHHYRIPNFRESVDNFRANERNAHNIAQGKEPLSAAGVSGVIDIPEMVITTESNSENDEMEVDDANTISTEDKAMDIDDHHGAGNSGADLDDAILSRNIYASDATLNHLPFNKHDQKPDLLRTRSQLQVQDPESKKQLPSSGLDDRRYNWFFNDCFDTDKAKYGYDRFYTEIMGTYRDRQQKFRQEAKIKLGVTELNDGEPMCDVCDDTSAAILHILGEVPDDLDDEKIVSHWIQTAWQESDAVSYIIHPATFNANETHPSLLAVLALLGMTLTPDPSVSEMALKDFTPTFLYVYECLVRMPVIADINELDHIELSKLQAFALIMRLDQLLLTHRKQSECFITSKYGRIASNIFFSKFFKAVPKAGIFGAKNMRNPIYATLYYEGYMFHQGADPKTQWHEWVLIESFSRVTMFSVYFDSIYSLTMDSMDPISIFNMDTYMICPDPLWYARSLLEFNHVVGPSRTIPMIPYLALLKSTIRFPRSPKFECIGTPMNKMQNGSGSTDSKPPKNSAQTREDSNIRDITAWSHFALQSLSHGIITILATFSGVHANQGNGVLTLLMYTHSNNLDQVFKKLDFEMQLRLYRAADVWRLLFEASYGDFTDKVLNLPTSTYIPLRLDLDKSVRDDIYLTTPHYCLLMIFCYFSSFIFVHEDLPIVLEVTANLKIWLNTAEESHMAVLSDYLYMPLYRKWIETEDAKAMIGACLLYLLWLQSSYGQIYCKNQKFLSSIIYISAVVVWLYDYASHEESEATTPSLNRANEKRIENHKQDNPASEDDEVFEIEGFAFMSVGTKYLQTTFERLMGRTTEEPKGVKSMLLLAACLLFNRTSTKPWIATLIKLVRTLDNKYTYKELDRVVRKSAGVYSSRYFKSKQASGTTVQQPARGDDASQRSPSLSKSDQLKSEKFEKTFSMPNKKQRLDHSSDLDSDQYNGGSDLSESERVHDHGKTSKTSQSGIGLIQA